MDGLSEARVLEIRENFDLSDLSKTGLLDLFQSTSEPFEITSGKYERLWYEEHVKILEKVESGIGKKLGYDSNGDSWFFEQWGDEAVIKSWKQGYRSWGQIEKNDGTKENWNFLPDEESYEFFKIEPDNEYGSKAGKKPGLSWKEIWHKKPGDSKIEKFWVSPEKKWGEKSGQTGSKVWSLEWKEQGTLTEESSKNEENGKTWGHVRGKNGVNQWEENWSAEESKTVNDKWWSEEGRSWGVKNINENNREFCEEWEEKQESKRNTKNFKDQLGNRSRYTEGSGNGFKFTEDYKYDALNDSHETRSQGFSSEGKWESYFFKKGSKDLARHKGEDANGHWEEEWEEDNGHKTSWKKGFSHVWGTWEEKWQENGTDKWCKKWGQRDEEWNEEWSENAAGKKCRKEQRKDGRVFVQEWEEVLSGGQVRCFGKFFEDGNMVKEWDYCKELE